MMLRPFFFSRRLQPYFFTTTPFHSCSETPAFSFIHSISSSQSFTFGPRTSATSARVGISAFPINALQYSMAPSSPRNSSATRPTRNVTKGYGSQITSAAAHPHPPQCSSVEFLPHPHWQAPFAEQHSAPFSNWPSESSGTDRHF